MAEPSTGSSEQTRKIRLVGELVSKTNQLRDAFKGIESSSNAFANNLARAVKAFNTAGNALGGGSTSGFSGFFGTSNTGQYFDDSNPTPSSSGFGGYHGGGGVSGASYTARPASLLNPSDQNKDRIGGTIAEVLGQFASYGGPAAGGAIKAGLGGLMMAAPNISDAMMLQNISSRYSFYGGSGSFSNAVSSAAKLGLPTSPMDAINAANMSIAYGMLPGNFTTGKSGYNNYQNFLNSAATVSALAPGVGLTGGIGAMGALNQGRSVNMLRMIGINVRPIGGNNVSSISDVIEQLWKILTAANPGVELTAQDIAVSAMPGNALDSLLNQYFGGDQALRFAVLTGLMQKVRKGKIDRSSLGISGVLSSAANLNAATLSANISLMGAVNQGTIGANKFATDYVNSAKNLADKSVSVFGRDLSLQSILQLAAFADAFTGIGGGAGGVALNGILQSSGALGNMLGNLLGGNIGDTLGKLFSRGAKIADFGLLGEKYISGFLPETKPRKPTPPPDLSHGFGGAAYTGNGTVVNVTMHGGTWTDAHSAGQAIARRVSRDVLSRGAAYV